MSPTLRRPAAAGRRKLASWLHYDVDPRVGLNGKRGNPNDISDDVLAIRGEGSAVDVSAGGAPMEIIDVIGRAGAPNAAPQWGVAPGGPGDRGAWVKPARVHDALGQGTNPGPGPAPTKPCPDPSAHLPKPKAAYPGDGAFVKVGVLLAQDYAAGGQALDPGAVIWLGRILWDHLNEGLSL
jgi:hypothetical protein